MKYTDNFLKDFCEKEGYTFIRSYIVKQEYDNGTKVRYPRYMDIIHNKCGKEYACRISKFVLENQRCMCERKRKYASIKSSEEYQEKLNKLYGNGTYTLIGEYIGRKKPVKIKHSCGYSYTVPRAEMTIDQETKCPICNNNKHRNKEETELRLKQLGYDMTLLEEPSSEHKVLIHNNKCGHEYEIQLGYYFTNSNKIIHCPHCKKYGASSYEYDIIDYIKTFYHGEIIHNYRYHNRELDIYLPEKNLGIEIDGLYWHSTNNVDKRYQINKTKFFYDEGIRVVHIFEDEMLYKREIVLDKLHSMISKCDNIIYARKCKVYKPTTDERRKFLLKNHIQGDITTSKIIYGLKYEDKLVAVMCFDKHKTRGLKTDKDYYGDNVYELTRYATLLDSNVIGGFGKLLKEFQKEYKYNKLLSYGDIRYTGLDENVYSTFGFEKDHITDPNYYYVKNARRLSKYGFRRSALQKRKDIVYDEDKSEKENMIANGYCIIYDCGLISYVLKGNINEEDKH